MAAKNEVVDVETRTLKGSPKFVRVDCQTHLIKTIGDKRYAIFLDAKPVERCTKLVLTMEVGSVPKLELTQILLDNARQQIPNVD